ncbi:xyloglucan 6-xylosyltransferase [Marchantia polymorpha subsp. ruderalis]|nr:hypothetical protein MARPO_0024s0009 [Marchantia polymorpha]BBN06573.1 hypothetical protein Mp_3g22310 [Marchantia polymorpha subsp. ruderalis]|eukprot:PTQ43473.1 hypothetical protein MARPO_0024s0009 [Marchantia polymorpha]
MEVFGVKKLKGAPPLSWTHAKSTLGSFRNKQSQKNLKLTLICLFLTILILRGTIGVGSFSFFTTSDPAPEGSVSASAVGHFSEVHRGSKLSLDKDEAPYRLGPRITDWDEQRAAWLAENPHMRTTPKGRPRMLLITGSQANSCKGPSGDHFLLKSIKNKIDYCRLHDVDIYYNMVLMQPEMDDVWIKLPLVRKMMLAHPEAEWIWWMDSDAMFTDMTFEFPIEKYEKHNMVIHGWEAKVFEEKDWCGLNAGVFLVRNNQWTLDFLDLWAPMGENRGNIRDQVGKMFTAALQGRPANFEADDQSGLVYLLNTLREEIAPKVYLESSYYLHGYWVILSEKYEEFMRNNKPGTGDHRWPFVTHFVGCKSCSGAYGDYPAERCLTQMERAFNFADNQVLEAYGFQHKTLTDSAVLRTRNETTRPIDVLRNVGHDTTSRSSAEEA